MSILKGSRCCRERMYSQVQVQAAQGGRDPSSVPRGLGVRPSSQLPGVLGPVARAGGASAFSLA